MAIEGILSGTIPQAGATALASRDLFAPDSGRGETVSVRRDHVALAAAGRLEGEAAALDRGRVNATTALSLLEVADAGLEEIDAKLTRLRELAAQAASVKLESTDPDPPDTSALERAILGDEFARLRAEVDEVAGATTFDGLQVLNGSGGAGAFTAAFNVGGGAAADDAITVSIEAATAANLSAGLATADLSTVAGAGDALTEVNAAIGKLDEIRAGVRGQGLRFHAAASGAARRASEATDERGERLAPRVTVEVARLVSERVLDEEGVSTVLHDAETLRSVLAALDATVPRAVTATPAADEADSGSNGTARAPAASSGTHPFTPLDGGPKPGSNADVSA